MGLTIPSFGQAGFMTLEDRYEVNNKFSSVCYILNQQINQGKTR